MSEIAAQIVLLVVQAAFAAGVLLALFSARRVIGLAPLYTSVGVFYYVATLLAGTTFVAVAPGLLLNPGSVALFPACIFAVLLVYIREDAKEARNMIYGLLAANVSATLLGLLVSRQLGGPLSVSELALSRELFVQSPRLFFFGLVALFADTVLVILLYEALSRRIRPLFVRLWLSLALVLAFDTLLFVTGGFVEQPAYGAILLSGLAGKSAAALIYAAALAIYLPRDAAVRVDGGQDGRPGLGDLFQVLTYRQKYEALQAKAMRDPLTGVHNRGYFDETLQAQMAAARRGGQPVSVMIVDVDHFKHINDTYGHSEGDRALREIAQTLVRTTRATDIVCRYGGEEFCIILPGTTADAAAPLADRVRAEIPAGCARAGLCQGTRVTVTIGLAAAPTDGSESDALLRAADRRLYRGKDSGRDRVVAA